MAAYTITPVDRVPPRQPIISGIRALRRCAKYNVEDRSADSAACVTYTSPAFVSDGKQLERWGRPLVPGKIKRARKFDFLRRWGCLFSRQLSGRVLTSAPHSLLLVRILVAVSLDVLGVRRRLTLQTSVDVSLWGAGRGRWTLAHGRARGRAE